MMYRLGLPWLHREENVAMLQKLEEEICQAHGKTKQKHAEKLTWQF